MKHVYTIVFAAAVSAAHAHAQVRVGGQNVRGVQTAPASVGGQPLLSGFRFSFGSGNDHHIEYLQLLPQVTSVKALFADKNFDDSYSWSASYYPMSNQVSYPRTLTGSCKGDCDATLQVPQGYVFVLQGFDFRFVGDDHHIDRIAIRQANNNARISFRDKNSDDQYSYTIRYALVRSTAFSGFNSSRGEATSQQRVGVSPGKFVIRGFDVQFTNEDHHISTFGIQEQNSTLTVDYRDKNGDDKFSWVVDWAILK